MELLLNENENANYYVNKLEKFMKFEQYLFNTHGFRYKENNSVYVDGKLKFCKTFYGLTINDIFKQVNGIPCVILTSEYTKNDKMVDESVKYARLKFSGYIINPEQNQVELNKYKNKYADFKQITKLVNSKVFVPMWAKFVESKEPFKTDKEVDTQILFKMSHDIPMFGSSTFKPLNEQINNLTAFLTKEKFYADAKKLLMVASIACDKENNWLQENNNGNTILDVKQKEVDYNLKKIAKLGTEIEHIGSVLTKSK